MVRSCLCSSELLSDAQEDQGSANAGAFSLGEEPGLSWDFWTCIPDEFKSAGFPLPVRLTFHSVVEGLGIAAHLYGYPEVGVGVKKAISARKQ